MRDLTLINFYRNMFASYLDRSTLYVLDFNNLFVRTLNIKLSTNKSFDYIYYY